ncbi:MAG TPA: carboxypeptidase-like regulatory domain-containing protein [Vicinamibacterales bacterium]|nr:carboxypeptidase-like regulatory domain-containing protein [Vicinamibacterales bacterium]
MRLSPITAACAVLVVFSGFWVACGDSTRGPGAPSGPPSVARLEIVGPASIAPGLSAQYSAIQFLSDGSSGPATGVTWSSFQPALLQVSATGLATAQPPLRGEATLQAELSATGRRASREVLVLPDGTFRLVGTVTEADATNFPVHGALVEAAADADPSTPVATFATTGPDGRYKLYGVPGDADLRVRKDGYVTIAERIQLATHATRNFELLLDSPRLALGGDYTMTVEAFNDNDSRSCGLPALPTDLRRRTYDAVIAQNGPQLTVTLAGPQFLVSGGQGNRFTGVVTATGATFEVRSYRDYYYYRNGPEHPDVVEVLPDGSLLVVTGKPSVTVTSAGLSGRMSGSLTQYRGSRFPNVIYLSGCAADRLTLTRR